MRWKKIVCAVDLSAPSRDALETAAELARDGGGTLTIVHVRETPPRVAMDLVVAPAPQVDLEAATLREAIEAWRTEAERRAGKPVATRLLVAPAAAHELVRFAREQGADLLVLATHGRSGLRRVMLGSVAEHVLREAPCPVLVVRMKSEARPVIVPPPPVEREPAITPAREERGPVI